MLPSPFKLLFNIDMHDMRWNFAIYFCAQNLCKRLWNPTRGLYYFHSNQTIRIKPEEKNTNFWMSVASLYTVFLLCCVGFYTGPFVFWTSKWKINMENKNTTKKFFTNCLLPLCILSVSWCSVCFGTVYFVVVPIKLICPHCLQHSFFEHLFY